MFAGCILAFSFLYVIIDIFTILEDILKQKTSIILLVKYYLSFMPYIFVQVSPFAGLLSTLYTFGKLNRDNEVIAMRSSGLSIISITKTVLIFGLISSLAVFLINDRIVPHALAEKQSLKESIEKGSNKKVDANLPLYNFSMYGLKNRLFFVNSFSLATNTMEGITILEHDEKQNITRKIIAEKGVFQDGFWTFYKSITYDFDQNGQIKNEPSFLSEEIMTIPETPKDFINQRQVPELMTSSQLSSYLWRLSKSGAIGAIRNLKIDLYERYASSLTNIIIILLGIPFALIMRRKATGLSSLGLSLAMGFLYYVVNAVSIALGKGGFLPAFAAVSLSHILAAAFSIYLISKLP
jgi:lipopolysaccharide export system permease protein